MRLNHLALTVSDTGRSAQFVADPDGYGVEVFAF
jgi:hypothetical protein